ncbi:MAG: hypothetical protein J6P28_05360 [Treponema sp.]|nr:hypothetical protein [Treponema sp.]
MKLNHYILAAFGLLAVMPFASCSSSGKKNIKESALAGKVYSAGFLNDKSEFYGYIISFNKDGSAQYFDSKTREEMSFSYKEDSAKNTFQMFSADDKNNQFEGLVEGSSIKYKTSTGQEVELSSGADNFYNFIVEKYKAWNKEGEVYLAGKDDADIKVISSIEQYDERKNIILKLEKGSYSETTDTTEYTYDDEGRLITERTKYETTNYSYTKRSDGTTERSYEDGYEIYNKDGKVIESISNGEEFHAYHRYQYDDKGNVINSYYDCQTSHREDRHETSYTYKYDSNGNITYQKAIGRNPDRDPYSDWGEDDISQTWFEYDSNNNLIHKKSNNSYDNYEKWYEYDSNNNLLHEKSKSSDIYNNYEKWYMYALYSDGKIKYKITLNNKRD